MENVLLEGNAENGRFSIVIYFYLNPALNIFLNNDLCCSGIVGKKKKTDSLFLA